ncbi:AGAP000893-PA-like protein [Anopheles sinensis]|uniref:AGAP000893-PA-like protein n=1 Tax=Anopheles sinensis TaxID=74873 RepID=A0A084VLG2_ANOSI|nr:AGAP000893-PA-like protein [Anopheles sinensis]
METYGESTGCYYNYNHYGEGDRIMTNEPCLNCTCHDRMLMCYLRVCPFTKAIGQDCTIEKREDQCCPVITCPAVEVQLLDHQTTASPSTALGGAATSEVGALDQYGCSISGRFYPEGAQVPSNPQKPCELCYCIRNMTTCVMQECTLHIDGCQPIYNKGVCCPVRYDCDHDKDTTPMLDDEFTTTVRPTPGFILTTTVSPSVSTDCVHNGETYADGALIMTDKPCEHCYCMRGDIVCAVQECGTPLENEGKNCVALPPAAGQCCPDKYMCDGGSAAPTTASSPVPTTSTPTVATTIADDVQEEQQKLGDDHEPSDDQGAPAAAQTTTSPADASKATTQKPFADIASDEKEDDDNDQQEQQHIVPQFEDTQEDDSEEEDAQVPSKTDDEQPATTGQPAKDDAQEPNKADDELPATTGQPAKDDVAQDHIPGHVGPHDHDEDKPEVGTTVSTASATVQPETTDKQETAEEGTTVTPAGATSAATERTETTDRAETANDSTTVAPSVDDSVFPVRAETTVKPETADESTVTPSVAVSSSTVHLSSESSTQGAAPKEPELTTAQPALVPTSDEKENEIGATHDEEESDKPSPSQDEQEQEENDDQQDATTPAADDERLDQASDVTGAPVPSDDEPASTVSAEKEPEQTTTSQREQPTKLDVTTEKKEPAHKADDVPQTPEDFVELPPAVIVTELPPAPISEVSTTEQTLAPPKDEILPNLPLEADSHVLADATTTEYAPAADDHKNEDDEQQSQYPVKVANDFDEPVEMNTVITPEKDEQKPHESVDDDQGTKQQEEVEHDHVEQEAHESDEDDSDEEPQSGDEHQQDLSPTTAKPVQSAVQPVDSENEDDNETEVDETPDKLFPESIPGEGDCLIEGVTYSNGENVPVTGKCQVACRCSNSITHCEPVRCDPAPNADCTAKNIPGECCPSYNCPEISSTTTETTADSNDSEDSKDSDSAAERDSVATESEASVSSSSTESSDTSPEAPSTASAVDSQSSTDSNNDEEDDESDKPSEAENDDWDLSSDVLKPLLTQSAVERDEEKNYTNFWNGNRPTTAEYNDVIVLSTSAPTTAKPVTTSSTASPMTTEDTDSDASKTTESTFEKQDEKDLTTTSRIPVDGKPVSAMEKEDDDKKQQDTGLPQVTDSAFEDVESTTVVAKDAEQSTVKEYSKPETSTDAFFDQQEEKERATTQRAFVTEDAETEAPAFVPEVYATTLKPLADIEKDEEQDRATTARPFEHPVDAATEKEFDSDDLSQKEQQAHDEIPSSTDRTDVKLATVDDDQASGDTELDTTTAKFSDAQFETVTEQEKPVPVTVYDHKRKQVVTTVAPTTLDDLENEIEQASTSAPSVALDEELTQKAQTQEEMKTTFGIPETTPSSSAMDTTSSKDQQDDKEASTTKEPEQAVPALDEKGVSDEQTEGSDEVAPTTAGPSKSDDSTQQVDKSTTVTPQKENDGSIVFRDEDEDTAEPIVKPTLDDDKPTKVVDEQVQLPAKVGEDSVPKPTKVADKDEDKTQPQIADEKDDDNLISPIGGAEQDGGIHFPQEKEKPIFKPTLDDVVQNTVQPEADDQVKEQEQEGSTSGPDATTKSDEEVRTTPQPESPVTKGHAEKVADESNEIDADVQEKPSVEPAKPVTPVKGSDEPENTLVYDEIEESDQQANVPSSTTPKESSVLKQQDVTQGVSDDDVIDEDKVTEHSKLATSSPTTAVPAVTATEQAESDEQEQSEVQTPLKPQDDIVSRTTVQPPESSSVLYEEKPSTSVPLSAESDEEPSSYEDKKPHGVSHDEEVGTTVSPSLAEQDEENVEEQDSQKPDLPASDDLEQDTTTRRSAEDGSGSEQFTEPAVSKQTVIPAVDRQTTIAPAQDDQDEDDAKNPLTDAVSDVTERVSDDQQEQDVVAADKDEDQVGATKVPFAQAGSEDSEETTTDAKSQDSALNVTPTTAVFDATEDSVKPDPKKPEQDPTSYDEVEDDVEPTRAPTAAVPEQDEKQHEPLSTESSDEKVEGTTTLPVKADDVEQEPAFSTPSDDQSKQPATVATPTEAAEEQTESDEVAKPEADEKETYPKEQGTTVAPSSVKPSIDAQTTEAAFDKPEEEDEEESNKPVAHDEVTGEEEEPASATTLRTPVRVSDDETGDEEPASGTTLRTPVKVSDKESDEEESSATTTQRAPAKVSYDEIDDEETSYATTLRAPVKQSDGETDEESADDETGDAEPAPATTLRTPAKQSDDEASEEEPASATTLRTPVKVSDEETGDDELTSATTLRTPVKVADDELTAATTLRTPVQQADDETDEEPQEQIDSEATTASSPSVVRDDVTESNEQDKQPQTTDSSTAAPKPTSTLGPVASDPSEDDDADTSSEQPKPALEQGSGDKEDTQASTTVASASEPEQDRSGEQEQEEPSYTPVKLGADEREQDKVPEVTTVAASVAQDDKGSAQSSEEDEAEVPQTDDLNADDDSSEEDNEPVAPILVPTTAQPTKAPSTTSATTENDTVKDVPAEQSTTVAPLEAVTHSTRAPDSDSQVTEQPTTTRQEESSVTEQASSSTGTAAPTTGAPAGDAVSDEAEATEAPHSAVTSTATDAPQDEKQTTPAADKEDEPAITSTSTSTTAAPTTTEQTTLAPTQKPSPSVATEKPTTSTVAPAAADILDERFDDDAPTQVTQKPVVPPADDKVSAKPQETSPDDSMDEDDDQQKVQEPSVASDSKPDEQQPSQPETVGPSYGAPGQHYDTGYGHMPPHYPPSSYEDDYGEEEDPAAFGPGTCRYGGKLYVSAQQIPRDDPCDFCFCFRSDIICLQQSCPPPISGCNEEPISGFCCPRYECPVSMATVLNVTTSTTTTTTTLPPHFPAHAYKGQVQKRGCQIQGKPYNVGEMVASASGPCMRCTCGGDGQMQCEPKACSPEPMLQQMIAVAASRRR